MHGPLNVRKADILGFETSVS